MTLLVCSHLEMRPRTSAHTEFLSWIGIAKQTLPINRAGYRNWPDASCARWNVLPSSVIKPGLEEICEIIVGLQEYERDFNFPASLSLLPLRPQLLPSIYYDNFLITTPINRLPFVIQDILTKPNKKYQI